MEAKRKKKEVINLEHGLLPPQAVELEEAVLGAIMLENEPLMAVIDILRPEMFYVEANQILFESIITLFTLSQPVDILTVTNELKRIGKLDTVGGAYYVSMLTTRIASTVNVEFHARVIVQKYMAREMIRIGHVMAKNAYDESNDVFDLLDHSERELFAVSGSSASKQFYTPQSLTSIVKSRVESNLNTEEKNYSGVMTGFSKLDELTNGLQPTDLIILAGRPGMGKTSLALAFAINSAIKNKIPTAIFSLEMSGSQLMTRLVSMRSRIDNKSITSRRLLTAEYGAVCEVLSHIDSSPIYIDDTASISVLELRSKARRMKHKLGIEFIIVDYLGLMKLSPGERRQNRTEEITEISAALKAMAKELEVPVLALSQLSRSVETRGGNKRPLLSDLRDSGAIEQDADIVMFTFRESYYQPENTDNIVDAEIIVAKHRNGSTAELPVKFVKDCTLFIDCDAAAAPDMKPNVSFTDYF